MFFSAALVFALSSLSPSLSYAQTGIVGVATGAQQKNAGSTTDGLLGFGAGLLQEFRSKGAANLGYEFGFFYLQRKPGRVSSYYDSSNWLEVALLARKHFGRFSFGLGGYIAHGYGNVTSDRGGVKTVAPLSDTLKDLDFGPQAAFGFRFYKKTWIEARYSFGVPNLAKAAGSEAKFREVDVLAGFKF